MKIVCGKCSADVELPTDGDRIECPSCGAVFRMPSLAEGEELPHPDTFPGYRIKAIIGHGGMGTVYRAIQLSMDREVAIKVLLRKYSNVPRFVSRFDREAAALATLNHPNIVTVIDRGRVEDLYYLVMEYVRGRTLRYYIKSSLLNVERCVGITIQVCEALQAAHDGGIVHRDIKPGNILVQEDGPVKVADFGIVHMVEQQDHAEQERRSLLGTAKYMAPEQRGTGEVIDPRADIYALGVTLFEMLTGELPKGEPPSAANPLVPPALDSIVEEAVARKRDDRFASATAMREALEVLLDSIKLEQTPATAAIDVPAGPTVACPVCEGRVPVGDDVCPHCDAALREPCYRSGCEGVNPVGAERCQRCGGHLELLKRQRRGELEALLEQAGAHVEAGRTADALPLYAEVVADAHGEFAPLRGRAGQAMGDLRRQRAGVVVRALAAAVAAFLIVLGAGVGAYWGIVKLAARTSRQGQPDRPHVPDPLPPTSADTRPDAPTTAPRHRVFDDYLLALTDDEWAKRPTAARLAAACDAGSYLARGPRDRTAAQRLAETLRTIERGEAPAPGGDYLGRRLSDALGSLCEVLGAELCSDRGLAPGVRARLARYRVAFGAASDPRVQVDIASSTIYDLMTSAELAHSRQLDFEARLLFLDASLPRAARRDGLRLVSDRLVRSARLLVRHLRRRGGSRAVPELLEDASRRAARAQREPRDPERLACAVEALVEALGSVGGAG